MHLRYVALRYAAALVRHRRGGYTPCVNGLLQKLVSFRPGEARLAVWAWLYLFCVFTAYSILRPIRDEMGVAGGVTNLPWLFTGTLVSMMAINPPFAWLVKRLPRTQFIGWTYRFFMLNLLIFFVLLRTMSGDANIWIGRVFFVWTAVFNLFVVSVFWSFMSDLFNSEQGKRLFGFIAAAATVGGMVGSGLTAAAVQSLGAPAMLLISIGLLEFGVFASGRLNRAASELRPDETPAQAKTRTDAEQPIGGSVFAGLTNTLKSPYLLNICAYMLLYTILSTFLYVQQAEVVDRTFADRGARTAFFAQIDFLVNALTLGLQLFITGRVLKHAGVALTLTFVPAITVVGFLLLGLMPTAAIVVGFTVLRRAGNFAFARPAREVLFTVVSREDKYKTKNLIDTVVYRFGDQVGVWSSAGVAALGLGAGAVAWAAVPLAAAWVANAWYLGRRQEAKAGEAPVPPPAMVVREAI